MPKTTIWMKEEDFLTDKEILRLCRIFSSLGICRIKLTGGEPLMRKNIVSLVSQIKQLEGIKEVTMTSNGVWLEKFAEELKTAGLDGINISLDTCNPALYEKITGTNCLLQVMSSIEKAVTLFAKVKINCVIVSGWNENDYIEVAQLAQRYPVDVRFIEMMPIGQGKNYLSVSNSQIQTNLEKLLGIGKLVTDKKCGNGPAVYYSFQGLKGNIGFISPMSQKFCSSCNRIRLTATGDLKPCLACSDAVSLKNLLKEKIPDDILTEIIRQKIFSKPEGHCFLKKTEENQESKDMFQIGG